MKFIRLDRASVVLPLLLLAGLEILTFTPRFFWAMFALVAITLCFGVVAALSHTVRERGTHVLILPLGYVGGVLLFHLFISQGLLQQGFTILAVAGFFLLISRAVELAFPTWNWLFTSFTFFLVAASTYGLRFHLRVPLWAVVGVVGIMTFLLTYHVLDRGQLSRQRLIFWGVLLALVISELLGALSLLPLSYLVVSGTLFVVFYVILNLLLRYLYGTLTTRMVREYLFLGGLAVVCVLGTAQWKIL